MSRHCLLLLVSFAAFAQDPYSTLPKNYSIELENDYLRISRVKYVPGERLPEHAHPARPTVYVYLTDGGPVAFSHKTPKFELERPPVKAGAVRFNRNAQVETHEVEYRGDAPSEFLRIELKTKPAPPHRDARLREDADFPWSDTQIRISRVRGALPPLAKPSVIVDIAARAFIWFDPKSSAPPAEVRGSAVIVELLSGAIAAP
jgi:hypothetical protein